MSSSVIELIMAVQEVHRAGYLHNDIHPSNLLVHRHKSNGTLTVKLGGFSQACAKSDGETPSFVLKPTDPLFQAPEVLAGGPLSEASDVWSLGVTLYTLACARLPFTS